MEKSRYIVCGTITGSNLKANPPSITIDDGGEKISICMKSSKGNVGEKLRKLRLKKGEPAVVLGAIAKNGKYYGWDVARNGVLSLQSSSVIRGEVLSVSEDDLFVKVGKKKIVRIFSDTYKIKAGDTVSATCFKKKKKECGVICKRMSEENCKQCKHSERNVTYTAFEIKKEEEKYD